MNVTYLIGAGASAQAIPTVRDFNTRFIIFIDLLIKDLSDKEGAEVVKFYEFVKEDVPTHYSIDTYARKLLFQDKTKYNAFKTLLSFYFLFEQMKGSEKLIENKSINEKTDSLKPLSVKKDPRYDAFFAALINKDTRRLADNIAVISWNYDLQFELSFAEFLDIDIKAAFNTLATFPCPSSVDESYVNKARFLKLNGIAGIYFDYKSIKERRDSAYKLWIDPKSRVFSKEVLKQCNIWVDIGLNGSTGQYDSLLHFAWDEGQEIKQARERAYNIIQATESLIVIGYSFPNYNRAIDKSIFSGFNAGITKNIHLQVSDEDFDACSERFSACLPRALPDTRQIKKVPYRDLFYIDNSLL